MSNKLARLEKNPLKSETITETFDIITFEQIKKNIPVTHLFRSK